MSLKDEVLRSEEYTFAELLSPCLLQMHTLYKKQLFMDIS